MTQVAVTIWDRPRNDPAVLALLDRVRPQIAQIHVDPLVIERKIHEAADDLRARYPGMDVWCGVPGDGHGPDPSDAWVRAYRAASAAGLGGYVIDAEEAWKKRGHTQTERLALAAHVMARLTACRLELRAAGKHLPHIGFTSYDTVEAVSYLSGGHVRYWGGHSDFPWKAFIGPDSIVEWHFPQVYAAGAGDAPPGALQTRDRRSRQSMTAAERKHVILAPGEGLAHHVYLQSHHTPEYDLMSVAHGYKVACFWATPTRLDEAGTRAMERLAREHEAMVAGKLVGEAVAPPLHVDATDWLDVECHGDVDCHPESAMHLAADA